MRGHEYLEKELKKKHLDPREMLKEDKLTDIAKRFGYTAVDDLLAALGDGALTANQVINKQKELFFQDTSMEDIFKSVQSRPATPRDKDAQGLRIKGVDAVAIRLARCCNPLPGDQILGYITRGRGVSVHRRDCPNMQSYMQSEPDRMIEVEWADDRGVYGVELEVRAIDRPRLTTDVMIVIADTKIHINSVYSRITKHDRVIMNFKLEIKDMSHLQAVIQRIQKVRDVVDVKRVLPGEYRSE